jgi:hypothetical protein
MNDQQNYNKQIHEQINKLIKNLEKVNEILVSINQNLEQLYLFYYEQKNNSNGKFR